MKIDNLDTIEALDNFLKGNQSVAFSVLGDKQKRYQFIRKILVKFSYTTHSKANKGVIKRFLMKVTGYSRPQLTRLVEQHKATGKIEWKPCRDNGFAKKYNDKDIRLLAKTDQQHESPCGHTVKKLCERAYKVFNEKEYQNLAQLSVSHLYNLRGSKTYTTQRRYFDKTKPRQVAIGERRKPQPNGEPGYIRIDTVHQGDLDKVKGVYYINAVDEVTQYQIVCSVEKISEQYLIPIVKLILKEFPFVIKGFHSDNGSEYINKNIAKLLQKLFVEFTKSRSRKSNDNGLVESKNARVIRKQFGYSHIPQKWAPKINEFSLAFLVPYINFHRPCFFPEIITDNKGKIQKKYPYDKMMTPFDKLKSLPNAKKHLKPNITFEILETEAMKMTDNKAAELLQKEKLKLFNQIFEQNKKRA